METKIIALEGVAGSGKTTLVRILQQRLGNTGKVIDEFPSELAGGFLEKMSREDPSFSLSTVFPTPLSQTFMLAANAAYKIEKARQLGRYELVIMDRCVASVLAYQSVILDREGKSLQSNDLMNFVKAIMPLPDITFYLHCESDVVKSRIQGRSGMILPPGYFGFLDEVASQYEKVIQDIGKVIILEATDSLEKNISKILEEVELDRKKDNHISPNTDIGCSLL